MPYTPEMGRRFWFEFDNATQGDPEFGNVILSAGGFAVQNDYRQTRMAGTLSGSVSAEISAKS